MEKVCTEKYLQLVPSASFHSPRTEKTEDTRLIFHKTKASQLQTLKILPALQSLEPNSISSVPCLLSCIPPLQETKNTSQLVIMKLKL